MRCEALAAVFGLSLMLSQNVFAATPVGQVADPPAAPAASPAAAPPSDAAAKHAKLTACLKQAKTQKLVGAEKSAFLRSCRAAP